MRLRRLEEHDYLITNMYHLVDTPNIPQAFLRDVVEEKLKLLLDRRRQTGPSSEDALKLAEEKLTAAEEELLQLREQMKILQYKLDQSEADKETKVVGKRDRGGAPSGQSDVRRRRRNCLSSMPFKKWHFFCSLAERLTAEADLPRRRYVPTVCTVPG